PPREKMVRLAMAISTKTPPPAWKPLHAAYDVGQPTPTRLLVRGNHQAPGEEVDPAFLQVLCVSGARITPTPALPHQGGVESSGRRLALARWLTEPTTPANSLVLRVRANRVWQHLFGRGLVETADNFGVTGAKPTHPELLDCLACEFARNGQRLKP